MKGKSAGSNYWQHACSAIEEMGFSYCKADPDYWIRSTLKANGFEHYQHVLLYHVIVIVGYFDARRMLLFMQS